jgi:hypothetical protein
MLYAGYLAAFIARSSQVVGDTRAFLLCDDAMVSMRYALNLVSGHGLLWNPGAPRVEGFSNPLWVLVMALAHLLPLSALHVSFAVQLASALLLLAGVALAARLGFQLCWPCNWEGDVRESRQLRSNPTGRDVASHRGPERSGVSNSVEPSRGAGASLAALLAAALTAVYLPLNHWALMGMEVALNSTLVLALAVAVVERRFWLAVALCAALPWVRLDASLAALVAAAFLGRSDRRHALLALVALSASLAVQTLARLLWFGELLPNTYYLKMTGFPTGERVLWGAARLGDLCASLFGVALVLALVHGFRIARLRPLAALLAMQLGYAVWVGADAWDWWWHGANRFIAAAAPLAFVLIAHALVTVFAQRPRHAVVFGAVVAIAGASFHRLESLKAAALLKPPFEAESGFEQLRVTLAVAEATRPGARVAMVWAGITGYFSGREGVDLLGKNDPVIARGPAHPAWPGMHQPGFWPGHMKWDFAHSIGELQPDVIVETWPVGSTEVNAYLGGYRVERLGGREVWVREGSPRVQAGREEGLR